MREIVEERLGVPLIQAPLPKEIAGATIMTTDDSGDAARGIILNAVGANRDAPDPALDSGARTLPPALRPRRISPKSAR